jgi:hypothetical protein
MMVIDAWRSRVRWRRIRDSGGAVGTSPPPSLSSFFFLFLATGLIGDDTYLSSSYSSASIHPNIHGACMYA